MSLNKFKEISKVIFLYLLTILAILILLKLSIFYIPFLIGFVIAELLEPTIKFVRKKTNFTRKTSSILVVVLFFIICIVIILIGIVFLVSETSNFLYGLNRIY